MSPKRGFFGPMKVLDSAEHRIENLPDGRLRAWIRHDTMRGVTPAILRWWFEHIDAFTRFNGRDFTGPEVPVYRLWHPYDHIAVRWRRRVRGPDGRLAPGSVIHIEENLGGRYPVRATARVTRFDDAAFNFDLLLGGVIPAASLDHEYAPVDGGCSFYTCLTVGTARPGLGPALNRVIRRLAPGEAMLRAWVVHNVEESGETEKFVPALFEHAR